MHAINVHLSFPLEQPVAIFLLVLSIILLAPMLFGRLKIPNIVGMIIAGMAVGPYGFNLLARDASFEIFGQVGILYLMFLAGVEIDMYNLKRNLRGGIVFGLLTFLIPMVVGIFGSRWAFHTGWSTAVLLSTMYASHTLISYPIVGRFGLSSSKAVVMSVCGTIVAVLLALVTLAEVVGIRISGGFRLSSLVWLAVSSAIFAGLTSWLYPMLTRRVFRRYSDPVTQFIYILAMVLLASLVAALIGLEAILGAFLAGLVLNRFVPVRSALMNRIVFVGNAIFIPYFLIGVGMLINIRLVFGGWEVARTAVLMTIMALSAKWISAYITQHLYGMDSTDRRMVFGLSSGKAAATIAATMVGYQYGLLDESMMNGAVVMILVCCAVASVTTERAALTLRIRLTAEGLRQDGSDGERMNARQLVAVANPVTAEEIMNLAILMRHPDNDSAVTALFVRNTDDSGTVSSGRMALKLASQAAQEVDIKVDEVERYDINVVTGMVNVMKEHSCTDLILGMHRKSTIVDTFFGSVIEQLLRTSNKMIIMSRCFVPVDTIRRIVTVVPTKSEYETGFRRWVERIGNLATQLGAKVVFICSPETSRYIRGVLAAGKYSVDCIYRDMLSWDDFVLHSADVEYDDLMIVIGARRTSVSFSTDLENLPAYLTRYHSAQNLIVMYPEQFGATDVMPQPIDVLSQTFSTNPARAWLSPAHLRDMISARRRRRHIARLQRRARRNGGTH